MLRAALFPSATSSVRCFFCLGRGLRSAVVYVMTLDFTTGLIQVTGICIFAAGQEQ